MFSLLLSLFLGFAQAQDVEVADFSGGLNTYQSPLQIADNESPSLNNVVLDKSGSLQRREGRSKLNQTAIGVSTNNVNAVYRLETSGGTKYCVGFADVSGYYSTDGCQTFTVFISTLTAGNDVNCDPFQDKLHCVNNQQEFAFTGAASAQNNSAAPDASKYVRVHRNRCFMAGATAQPSRLYFSALNDCFTFGSLDYIDVSPNDGDVITGIGPSLYDVLIIYKKFSTWGLKGVDQNTFVLYNISREVGALNHRSIANLFNLQLFDSLGPNGGQPGVYGFDGMTIREYSKKIRGDIDIIDTFRAVTNRKTLNSKSDWDSGAFNIQEISTARSPGVLQSTYTVISDSGDFNFDVLTSSVSVSTNSTSNTVTLHRSSWSMTNGGFEDLNFTNWTLSGSGFSASRVPTDWIGTACSDVDVATDTYAVTGTGNFGSPYATLEVQDANGNFIESCTINFNSNCTYSSDTCDVRQSSGTAGSGSTTNQIGLQIANSANYSGFKIKVNEVGYIATSDSAAPADYVFIHVGCLSSGGNQRLGFRSCKTANYKASGNYTSQSWDTYISTPVWGTFQVNQSSNSNQTITYQTESSYDNSTWATATTATPELQITAPGYRYIRYKASLATNAPGSTPSLTSVSFTAASTGTWRSPEMFLSNNISNEGWGLFQTAQTTNGNGAIAYSVRVSTYSGGTTYAPWTAQTAGNEVVVSTGAYFQIISTFTVKNATETAKVTSIVINWNEGAQATSPAASVFQNRYHYCGQSLGGSYNDICYVLDTNKAWVKWDNMTARSLGVVNQNLIMGTSTKTSSGYVYQLYNSDSDDGTVFNSHYKTKDFSPGKLTHRKGLDKIVLVHQSGSGHLTVDAYGDTGLYNYQKTVSLSTGTTYGIQMIPVESTINGNTFSLKMSNTSEPSNWRVLGIGMSARDVGEQQP